MYVFTHPRNLWQLSFTWVWCCTWYISLFHQGYQSNFALNTSKSLPLTTLLTGTDGCIAGDDLGVSNDRGWLPLLYLKTSSNMSNGYIVCVLLWIWHMYIIYHLVHISFVILCIIYTHDSHVYDYMWPSSTHSFSGVLTRCQVQGNCATHPKGNTGVTVSPKKGGKFVSLGKMFVVLTTPETIFRCLQFDVKELKTSKLWFDQNHGFSTCAFEDKTHLLEDSWCVHPPTRPERVA